MKCEYFLGTNTYIRTQSIDALNSLFISSVSKQSLVMGFLDLVIGIWTKIELGTGILIGTLRSTSIYFWDTSPTLHDAN